MADLTRADFDACLDFLAGKLQRSGRRIRARSRRSAALDVTRDSGDAKAGLGFAAAASPAGSGTTWGPSTRKRPFESWKQALPSARSRRRTPSDSFRVIASFSTAALSSSAASSASILFARSSHGRARACRAGRAPPVTLVRAGPRARQLPRRGGAATRRSTEPPLFVPGCSRPWSSMIMQPRS